MKKAKAKYESVSPPRCAGCAMGGGKMVWDDREMNGGEEDGWLIRGEPTERSGESVTARPETQTASDQCK